MKKSIFSKYLARLIVLIMIFSELQTMGYANDNVTNSITFYDIKNHYAENIIYEWAENGFISGMPDGTFAPRQEVTRAEFIALFNRAFKPIVTDLDMKRSFSDVKSTDWYYNDVILATRLGIISGYPGDRFGPNDPIKREDASVIISRYLNLTEAYEKYFLNNFSDSNNISDYAISHVCAMLELKLINGRPDGTFAPKENITRADSIIMLNNTYKILAGDSGIIGKTYNDNKSLSGATITIYKKGDYKSIATVNSNKSALYGVKLDEGTYDIITTKNDIVSFKSGVLVRSDYHSLVKMNNQKGQEVKASIKDVNNKPIKDVTIYFKSDVYFSATSSEKGDISLILPKNREYECFYEKKWKAC